MNEVVTPVGCMRPGETRLGYCVDCPQVPAVRDGLR
jgi:hypothetical protein